VLITVYFFCAHSQPQKHPKTFFGLKALNNRFKSCPSHPFPIFNTINMSNYSPAQQPQQWRQQEYGLRPQQNQLPLGGNNPYNQPFPGAQQFGGANRPNYDFDQNMEVIESNRQMNQKNEDGLGGDL
jgi:hypothetical protein